MGIDLDLTTVWAFVIAFAVFAYVVMDGFDLGVGILFPWIHGREDRDLAVNTVAPVWDGNETWLILGGGGLFGVFPLAYATIMPAVYMPIIVMLLALIVSDGGGALTTQALPFALLANPADAFRLFNLAAAEASAAAGGMGGAAAAIPLWHSALSIALWPLLALMLAIAAFRKVSP